jgi:hypothetical protein
VSIRSSTLSGSGGDGSQQSTGLELLLKEGVDLSVLLSLFEDSLNVARLLDVGGGLLGGRLESSGNGLGVLTVSYIW